MLNKLLPKSGKGLDDKGMATLEMIPILVIFVLLLNFSFGFFGVVHTGILNSIAARNYTFETLRNRASVIYFTPYSNEYSLNFKEPGFRAHGVIAEDTSNKEEFVATTRLIDFFTFAKGRAAEEEAAKNSGLHVNKIQELDESGRNDTIGANPVWIKTVYGMCLNETCTAK